MGGRGRPCPETQRAGGTAKRVRRCGGSGSGGDSRDDGSGGEDDAEAAAATRRDADGIGDAAAIEVAKREMMRMDEGDGKAEGEGGSEVVMIPTTITTPPRTTSDMAATTVSTTRMATTSTIATATAMTMTRAGQSSNFRNVSACNRCRLRKNRCDQRLPSCASCAKAGAACVGYDPITKKEIPRSYVFYLETRLGQLERLLVAHDIPFSPAEELGPCSRPAAMTDDVGSQCPTADSGVGSVGDVGHTGEHRNDDEENDDDTSRRRPSRFLQPRKTISPSMEPTSCSSGAVKTEETAAATEGIPPTRARSLASTSGVSFARVVYAAVEYSVTPDQEGSKGDGRCRGSSDEALDEGSRAGEAVNEAKSCDKDKPRKPATSMRDSFFGLHTKPTMRPASFPDREVGLRLVTLYFEHANPQIPILHRPEFMRVFERAYDGVGAGAGPGASGVLPARELYLLNMVFAIGCGVIVGDDHKLTARKRQRLPEEYHASAIVHLESCLSFRGGGLEVLQAVLLLANFALLRPVPPGLWYITGVAVRLAVDLGLHHEDGGSGVIGGDGNNGSGAGTDEERGRRLWMRDMRRRLWWCTYSVDRLVSSCVGRPVGVSDQVVTTELPSLLDDALITPTGFGEDEASAAAVGRDGGARPSYKRVAHHYFRLRMLQSEMLQVLQYKQAQRARAAIAAAAAAAAAASPKATSPSSSLPATICGDGGDKSSNGFNSNRNSNSTNSGNKDNRDSSHGTTVQQPPLLTSPYLAPFTSFRSWRLDMDRRLAAWRAEAPTPAQTGVAFSTEFLELNYWQALVMLYRPSLRVPAMFRSEYSTADEVNSPAPGGYAAATAERRDDEDAVCLRVAEAGQKILRIYRQLHLAGRVSYTYLSTHHLLMAGMAYLYAIWHSPLVRSRLTMDEVDFTVLAAKSVFSDMMDKCPPAETCRDAFDRTAKATIKMALSSGGFGRPMAMPLSLPPMLAHEKMSRSSSSPSPREAPILTPTPPPTLHSVGSEAHMAAGFTAHRGPLPPPPPVLAPLGEAPMTLPSTSRVPHHLSRPGAFMNLEQHQQQQQQQQQHDHHHHQHLHHHHSQTASHAQPLAHLFQHHAHPQHQHPHHQQQLSVAQCSLPGMVESSQQSLDFMHSLEVDGDAAMTGLQESPSPLVVDFGGFYVGFSWDVGGGGGSGLYSHYGDGQQVALNPFDTFFFGGGGDSDGGGGGGGCESGPASSHGSCGGR